MVYSYRYPETYDLVQEALYDLDSCADNGVFDAQKISEWVGMYEDLRATCHRDRYYNSCVKGMPCLCTNKNVEQAFVMLHMNFKSIKEWIDLEAKASKLLEQLLITEPGSEDEKFLLKNFNGEHESILFEVYGLEREGDRLSVLIWGMDYGVIELSTKGLEKLLLLSEVYWNSVWGDKTT